MIATKVLAQGIGKGVVAALLLLMAPAALAAQPGKPVPVSIGKQDIGGVVSGKNGPEAGVWVIAETTGLPTKFAKMVVTDDQGRYVLPELPQATYSLWVRGYGLIDSKKLTVTPGKVVNLQAVAAPTEAAAAEYFPAIYWYSMLKVPEKNLFPGTGPEGNGMPVTMKSQAQWLDVVKTNGCYTCHQLGNKATRTMPKMFSHYATSTEAWQRRIQSGQAMTQMVNNINRLDARRALGLFADWTDRIAKGELPASKPTRPEGKERNIVVTVWDWAEPTDYMHDEVATDKRNPTVNANGLIVGSTEESTDYFPVLDPVRHKATRVKMPVRDPATPTSKNHPFTESPYWGDKPIWDSQTSMHNPMYDERGHVWFTSRVGPPPNPDWCKKGSDHPSAKLFPMENAARHLSRYEPKTGKITLIRTCFPTHHVVLAEDANNTVWTSAGGPVSGVIGWLNRKMFDETGDEQKSQGWTALVLDTNGNGKRDDYVAPNQPVDPTKDKRIIAAFYGIGVNPQDNTIWGSVLGFPGYVIRLNPGTNPPETALAEIYEPPLPGYGPRGMDIDRNGLVWVPLSSGHMASFDRKKCKGPLNGPKATGQHCPEGWTLYPFPGPQLQNVTDTGSAEASYYTWVDQFDTFGLGKNVAMATGNANESLMALVDEKWINMRVPYPMGFYAKWMDGRIDNPNTGWKGRGMWATTGTRTPFHMEGGKGTRPKVVKFQMRPDPLAR
ncbi:MAG TPA: carboxypeptidase-like regulatory domain-containing protein [Burkholderiales bacterium]|nr:carboxypeptidase-like regulatory domain-containing protein [Burkholderiales bacterium]